jgi:DNA polymerase-1
VTFYRWAKAEPFNLVSPDQVKAYCKFNGYKLLRDRKTRRETTSKEAITQLIKKHPDDRILRLVLESRHLSKAIGYLDDSRLGRDGKFHPTYTFAPDTGRLASINPNFQNQPKHGVDEELAHAIRETIVPGPGMVLVELDWKAIEAVLTGWFADDEGFARLSLVDSHSFLAWHIAYEHGDAGPPPSPHDENLAVLLQDFKASHGPERELAKKVNHATSYGMGAKHLSDLLKVPKSEAIRILEIKDNASPRVAEWKAEIRKRAHYDGFLENPFGYRRYFTDIFRKSRYSGKWILGEEANKCLAFLPQSTAAAMLRSTISALPKLPGYNTEWFPLVPIHDAILFEVQDDEATRVRATAAVTELMQREWEELGGLSIQVDGKWGHNWGDMTNDT